MKLRIQIILFFSLSLIIGYITGLYSAHLRYDDKLIQAADMLSSCTSENKEIHGRLDSLCGPAALKFVPCENGLEVCVCGDPAKYLE